MNKREFIRTFAEANNLERAEAAMMCNLVFAHIKKMVLKGIEVRIHGVGKFKFKYIPARNFHSNLTGEKRPVPAKLKLRFSAFPGMRKLLKESLKRGKQT